MNTVIGSLKIFGYHGCKPTYANNDDCPCTALIKVLKSSFLIGQRGSTGYCTYSAYTFYSDGSLSAGAQVYCADLNIELSIPLKSFSSILAEVIGIIQCCQASHNSEVSEDNLISAQAGLKTLSSAKIESDSVLEC